MKTFENKRVLITGGTSGIGKATALAFAKEGANVVALAAALPRETRSPGRLLRPVEGSKTTQGRTATRTHAPVRVAFRYANNVGTLN